MCKKGRPKLHIAEGCTCRKAFPMCNLERPFLHIQRVDPLRNSGFFLRISMAERSHVARQHRVDRSRAARKAVMKMRPADSAGRTQKPTMRESPPCAKGTSQIAHRECLSARTAFCYVRFGTSLLHIHNLFLCAIWDVPFAHRQGEAYARCRGSRSLVSEDPPRWRRSMARTAMRACARDFSSSYSGKYRVNTEPTLFSPLTLTRP